MTRKPKPDALDELRALRRKLEIDIEALDHAKVRADQEHARVRNRVLAIQEHLAEVLTEAEQT